MGPGGRAAARGGRLVVPREERRALFAALPDGVTDRMPLEGRAGKVLVDWRQNDPGRSIIAPWSLGAARVPRVAAPLRWE